MSSLSGRRAGLVNEPGLTPCDITGLSDTRAGYAGNDGSRYARSLIRNLPQPTMNRLSQFCALGATFVTLGGCSTMTDLVTSNLPESHSGRPAIVVSLRQQEAYIYRAGHVTASSRISSGREGYRTPTGRFRVIRKDEDHRSSVYGDYVDDSGRVVKANVDSRCDPKPRHSHFVGAPMPYFLEFSPGYGLHQGYLPGEPASHGCIRMPYWKARQFYNAAHIGTPVVVKL
jgi:hypothetical protein